MQNDIPKALVSCFDAHNDRVPHEILALEAAGVVEVAIHLAYKGIVSFPTAETIPWPFYYEPDAFSGPPPSAALSARLEPVLPDFLLQQARVILDFTQTDFRLNTLHIHSDLSLFHRLAGFFEEKLTQHSIDVVLFDEVPHYGMDFLLFHTARAMGIRTLIFHQNVNTERCILVEHFAEIGHLMGRPVLAAPMDARIERRFEKDLYAPVDLSRNALKIQLKEMHRRQVRWKTLFGLLVSFVSNAWQLAWKGLRLGRFDRRGDRVNRFLHPMMGVEIRKFQARQTLEWSERFVVSEPDLEARFVYFALHMQPEATTYPLGGDYCDQLRAIEHLARMLPDDCWIYVKEHPDDRGQFRDPHFYMRLDAIPRVRLVAASVSSHVLMAKCLFVSTITGTGGWEAVTGGKPALTFGYAWYNDLPGVFKIADAPRFEDIIGCEIDHAEVQARFHELSRRLADFTPAWGLEPHQFPKNFDREANAKRFVETLRRILAAEAA